MQSFVADTLGVRGLLSQPVTPHGARLAAAPWTPKGKCRNVLEMQSVQDAAAWISPVNLSWHGGENWLSLQEVQMEHLMESSSAPTSGSNEYGLCVLKQQLAQVKAISLLPTALRPLIVFYARQAVSKTTLPQCGHYKWLLYIIDYTEMLYAIVWYGASYSPMLSS